jgi:Flp pilus assembly protein TadG
MILSSRVYAHPAQRLPGAPFTASARRGAAVVEFAVVAVLFVFLMLGLLEISRALVVKQALSDTARRACRTGSQPETSNAAIINDVNNLLTDNSIAASNATITILVNGVAVDASTAQQNDKISVKVSVPASKVLWVTAIFMNSQAIESSTVVMMRNGS